jgi:hypothetical protein
MDLSKLVAALALVLAGVLVSQYSQAADREMAPKSGEAREAMRQVALAEHERRKRDVTRLCAKPRNNAEMEACRAAYRKL